MQPGKGCAGNKRVANEGPPAISKKLIEPATLPPVFNHSEIKQLYCNEMDIDRNIIHKIFSLHRQTLIEDLEKAVMDSIARFDFLYDQTPHWDEKTHNFSYHSIFLLTELRSENSLHKILVTIQPPLYESVPAV